MFVGKVIQRLTLTLIFIFSAFLAHGQCTENLINARDEFTAGHLYGIPAMLKECLEKGFSRSEKMEAYRLLTITYLYIDDPIGAESSFLALLKIDPEYRIQPNDPIELDQLSKQFITTPIVSWTLKAGLNNSFFSTIHVNGSDNTNNTFENTKFGYGFNLQGSVDVHFSSVVSLVVEAELNSHSFKYSNAIFNPDSLKSSKPQRSQESGLYASLPIYLRLTYPGKKFYPYVYAGYSPEYNFFEKTKLVLSLQTLQDQGEGTISQSPIVGPSLTISDLRKSLTHALIFGIGVKRRIGYKYILLDVRYKAGLSNYLNTENQFESLDLDSRDYLYRYGIVDNDQRLNNLSVTVGFVWPLYRPRKKNEVTLQTFIKKWFNKDKSKSDE